MQTWSKVFWLSATARSFLSGLQWRSAFCLPWSPCVLNLKTHLRLMLWVTYFSFRFVFSMHQLLLRRNSLLRQVDTLAEVLMHIGETWWHRNYKPALCWFFCFSHRCHRVIMREARQCGLDVCTDRSCEQISDNLFKLYSRTNLMLAFRHISWSNVSEEHSKAIGQMRICQCLFVRSGKSAAISNSVVQYCHHLF